MSALPYRPHKETHANLIPRFGTRPMLLFGAPNDRREKTPGLCKSYLRLKHGDKPGHVEAFIAAVDQRDGWDQLTDIENIIDDVLGPLDHEFEGWVAAQTASPAG